MVSSWPKNNNLTNIATHASANSKHTPSTCAPKIHKQAGHKKTRPCAYLSAFCLLFFPPSSITHTCARSHVGACRPIWDADSPVPVNDIKSHIMNKSAGRARTSPQWHIHAPQTVYDLRGEQRGRGRDATWLSTLHTNTQCCTVDSSIAQSSVNCRITVSLCGSYIANISILKLCSSILPNPNK